MNTIMALVVMIHGKGLLHGYIELADLLTAQDGSLQF